MITRTKRFSIICVTSKMKERKKRGAMLEPPLPVSIQSNMNRFQSSPVEIEKSRDRLRWKFVKFFHSLIASPSTTLWKNLAPKTAMMKKMSISSINTLSRSSTDIWIVLSRDCRPLYWLANRSTRLTLSTLRTRAS